MLALWLCLATQVAPPGTVLLDGVAAQVERELILRSDVERSARLQLARAGGGLAAARVALDDKLLVAVLNLLIVEELVDLDCRRKQRYPETEAQVNEQAQKVKDAFQSDEEFQEFLRRMRMAEGDFQELMRREVRVNLLLSEQMRGAPVSDEELEHALAENAALKALAASQGKHKAREALVQRRAEDRAAEYVEALKRQTAVKVVARFGTPP